MTRILNLKKDERQWYWTVEDTDYWSEETTRTDYFTDKEGDGIFEIYKGARHQITGTCQFTLDGYSMSGARKKIKRWFVGH